MKWLEDYTWENYTIVDGIEFPYTADKCNIGIKLSGGIDSATILYTLAWLRKEGYIHPETNFIPLAGVNYHRPYQKMYGDRIVNTINQLLDTTIQLPLVSYGTILKDVETATLEIQDQLLNDGTMDIWYVGESKFLPRDYVSGTKWADAVTPDTDRFSPVSFAVLLDVMNPDNTWAVNDDDMKTRAWEAPDNTIFNSQRIIPCANMHKKHVKQVSDHFGVTEELLNVTRSCEYNHENGTPISSPEIDSHCGACYWCVERLVTYDRL